MTGVNLNLVRFENYYRSEIYINRGSQTENKDLFDFICKMKDSIETEFGGELEWERMDEKVSCRIKSELTGVSYFEQSGWNKMIDFLINTTVKMEKAF